jgi:hypothetical protein
MAVLGWETQQSRAEIARVRSAFEASKALVRGKPFQALVCVGLASVRSLKWFPPEPPLRKLLALTRATGLVGKGELCLLWGKA